MVWTKRKRKRPNGGGVCHDDDKSDKNANLQIEIDIVPLPSQDLNECRRVRVVRPYPFTFSTFAKQRWLGREILDVYHTEFGSYPRMYYRSAIEEGRILVSGRRVSPDYKIKGGDELNHTVHRHEPAVAIQDGVVAELDNNNNNDEEGNETGGVGGDGVQRQDLINVVCETDEVIVVDKPSTLPIHPCGGYNFNSLFHILKTQDPKLEGKLHTIHRLDRLTSGLTLIAKTKDVAKRLSKCISDRDCEKVYLTRVKGKFPFKSPADIQFKDCKTKGVPCECGSLLVNHTPLGEKSAVNGEEDALENATSSSSAANQDNPIRSQTKSALDTAALGYWISDQDGTPCDDATLQDVFDSATDIDSLLSPFKKEDTPKEETRSETEEETHVSSLDKGSSQPPQPPILWLNLACPCRIASHKNGVCESGDFSSIPEHEKAKVKPAQTAFAVVAYDEATDSTVVIAKPITGRTHQIRLHLQFLGHPIANDPNYGGELFYADASGKRSCERAKETLEALDQKAAAAAATTTCTFVQPPDNATTTDVPATEDEVMKAATQRREEGESLLSFIKKTCVWCARSAGEDRTMVEFLVRSQGIWLHAVQYRVGELTYRTNPPLWGSLKK